MPGVPPQMSRWTINFGTTEDGKVVLMLEPKDKGKPETLTLDLATAQSLSLNLTQAINEAQTQTTEQSQ